MIRRASILIVLLFAAACTPPVVTTVPGQPISLGSYSVTPQIEWNRPTTTYDEIWTVDGYALESLRFFDVPDGQALFINRSTFGSPLPPDEKTPVFRKTMLPNEIQEFVVATLAADGWADIKPSGLAPAKFHGLPGFRFSFAMKSSDGLDYEGMAYGAVDGGRLELITFIGTRLHYFRTYKAEVEKIFASVSG
jgi:hypothetical protein